MLQAGDSFYPTGSYAHSFGLEGLVQAGAIHDSATLETFLRRSVLPGLRHIDLPLAAHANRSLARPDWTQLGELCHLSAALRTSVEARQAADNIGRQRAELLARLHPDSLASGFLDKAVKEGWPFCPAISAALEGQVFRAPPEAVLVGVAYSQIAAVLSAAMKLLRLGQNACQALLAQALAEVSPMVTAAMQMEIDSIGWFNPWLDIASARHATADVRMFIS